MKTFYCVTTKFFDNGTVKATMSNRKCKEKPENTSQGLPRMNAYNDWFNSEADALAFLAKAKR